MQDDFILEEHQLTQTIHWVKKEKLRLATSEEKLKKEILQLRKEVSHLMDERLITRQQLHQYAAKDLKIMAYAINNPYFGRIDFKEKREEAPEIIYIGKYGLHDQAKEVPVVVDWRAPIADIYYSSLSQDVSYRTAYEEIEGTLYLKRRYEIKDGKLIHLYDEKSGEDKIEDSLKSGPDFLIDALNRTNQGRLKEIVATIQDQQNRVIRSTSLKPLVVQGVAGGGKTTIALHRMAYLIYHNRRSLQHSNYMVMAPNRLFLNYISDILPDLGVDNVTQTTFEDWALGLIGKKLKLSHRADQLNFLMNAPEAEGRMVAFIAQVKGSIRFKKVVDHFLSQLASQLLPEEPLSVEGFPVLEYAAIQKIFLTSNLHLSLKERIGKLKIYLKNKLKNEMEGIFEKIDLAYGEQLGALKEGVQDLEPIRPMIIALYDQRDEKKQLVKKNAAAWVDQYMAPFRKFDIFSIYTDLFNSPFFLDTFSNHLGTLSSTHLLNTIQSDLVGGIYQNEDLAPLAYLRIKLLGLEEKNKYAHIVVDEAQDFDEFKLSVLREISIGNSFTFVGDLSQGIYAYKGINDWHKTMQRVFGEEQFQYHVLTTSYRSTVEIVNLANEIIRKCPSFDPVLAEPVFRHGEIPQLTPCADMLHMGQQVSAQVRLFQEKGYQSIAIICKDLDTTRQAFTQLKKTLPQACLLSDQTRDFENGLVVIPSYLSKGLEFDAVLLWNVSQSQYGLNPIQTKLLYIGATRALHSLHLYYVDAPSKLLADLPKEMLIHQPLSIS